MNYYNNQGGRIEVICGPMFAGKTEELIRRVTRMEYAHKNFLVFKPLIDNRYSIDEVVSHSKYKKKAINIKEAKEILPYITDDIQAIVVDEVQFFDESMISVLTNLANKGLRVILRESHLVLFHLFLQLLKELLSLQLFVCAVVKRLLVLKE